MAFFILTRFALLKYSLVFVERPSQGTSSLASQLSIMSLDARANVNNLLSVSRNG